MRVSTDSFSFCMCQVFVAGFTLSWRRPLTPEVYQSQKHFSHWVWQQGLIAAYSTAQVCFLFGEAALWGTQITANTRNAFPPGGLWRLQGREKQEGESVWVRHVSDTGHVPAFCSQAWMTYTHKQTDLRFYRELIMSVCCLTLMTAGTQTDRDWSSLRKQINHPFLHKHRGPHVLI